MTNEELLAKAKRDYPVGTIAISLGGAGDNKVNLGDKPYIEYDSSHKIMIRLNPNLLLYKKSSNIWAKIISKPNRIIQIY